MGTRTIIYTVLLTLLISLAQLLPPVSTAQDLDDVIQLSEDKRHFVPFAYGGLPRNLTVSVGFSSSRCGDVYVHLLAYDENDIYRNGTPCKDGWWASAMLYDVNGTPLYTEPEMLVKDTPTQPVRIEADREYTYRFRIHVPAGLEIGVKYHLYFVIGLYTSCERGYYGAEYNPTALYDVYLYPLGDYFIKGRISATNGMPVAGARVCLRNVRSGDEIETTSDANGTYTVNIGDFEGGFTQGDTLLIEAEKGDMNGKREIVLELQGFSTNANVTISRMDSTPIDISLTVTLTFMLAALCLLGYFLYLGRDSIPPLNGDPPEKRKDTTKRRSPSRPAKKKHRSGKSRNKGADPQLKQILYS